MRRLGNFRALELYRQELMAAGISPGTIRLRVYQLDMWARACPVDLLLAKPEHLVTFMAAQEWGAETRKSMRSALRSFYGWAFEHGLTGADATVKLPRVRVPKGEPKPVPESVLAAAMDRADAETWRMLVLGAFAGLRRAEIARVHLDLVTDQGLRITGKGGHTRVVPMHPLVSQALEGCQGWRFPSTARPGKPVGPDYVHDRVSRVLPRPWTTHTLRHRFASRAYANTRDLRAVQTLLGHSTPETTARYVLVPDDSLAAAVAGL